MKVRVRGGPRHAARAKGAHAQATPGGRTCLDRRLTGGGRSCADRVCLAPPRLCDRWRSAYTVENEPSLVEWWESSCDGECLGPYFDESDGAGGVTKGFVERLEADELDLGILDAVVITAPCQDFCAVNDTAQGETGRMGKLFRHVPQLIRLLRRRHTVKAFVIEEAQECLASNVLLAAGTGILSTLRDTNHWVAYGTTEFWRVGVPTTRSRLGLMAISVPHMRHPGPFALPAVQGGDDVGPPQPLAPLLEPPEAIPEVLRERESYVEFGEGHVQSALPAWQIGYLPNESKSRIIYDPARGTALTLRANTRRAEGPGGVTGLYRDAISPRRLTPKEVLRIHGFPDSDARRSPLLVYHAVGNAVPAQWAAAVLRQLDGLLK